MTSFLRSTALFVLVACGGGNAAPTTTPITPTTAPSTNPTHLVAPTKTKCDAGDAAIATQTACLQDDAACYQLVDKTWCTGSRPGTFQGGGNDGD